APEGTPCLVVDSDADRADPFAEAGAGTRIDLAVCADFEDEAQCTAAQVLADLASGQQPVALIAQDRLLTRRVRALLARQDVPMQDETGWKLSTTRAAASVAGLLRAARRDSDSDEWLDWLKGCAPEWPGIAGPAHAARGLEVALRRHGWGYPASVDASRLPVESAHLWHAATRVVERLRSVRAQGLGAWLEATGAALEACGAMRLLRADEAGRQMLVALHLHGLAGSAHAVGGDEPMTLDDFSAWVDSAFEDGSYLPESAPTAPVVVTPLERAMLRPFGAVVFAAADEKRLGAAPPPQRLLGEAVAVELGVPGAAARRDAETLAFAQILRASKLSLLRRLDDGGESLGPSPLLERLELARARRGQSGLARAEDAAETRLLFTTPVSRPLPRAASLLPARLSASACEALRSCPYRFFALRVLGLREADELDDEVEKRDYGNWLHAVLFRFHATRGVPLAAADEEARLHAVARELQREMHFDAAAFLPFGATFARFAPRYVEWLLARDASGASWLDGEVELTARPTEWDGVEMHGIIDRVDSVPGASGPMTQLIDYKTGNAEALRNLVKTPQEDTQLAFYAALMAAQSEAGGSVGAVYLPLDERDRLKPIEHVDVETSARRLVLGIGQELARIRGGVALPALGEGGACTYCAARGLCRRDQWRVEEAAG
ncbi:MAG TPA: PD-(D/E)XK nuclease family protein, partial [Caldimonas sp.]